MSVTGIGPTRSDADREELREERRERRREEQDEQAARSVAQSAATQQGTAAPGYWDMLGDPDLDHPEWSDSLEAFAAAELSRAHALGNISRKDWQNLELRIENEFWQIENEMKSNEALADDDQRLLYGEERAELTDGLARRKRAAREVKKNITSLSVDARGLRSGTEIHAVARTEDGEGEAAEEGGLFAGVSNYLSG